MKRNGIPRLFDPVVTGFCHTEDESSGTSRIPQESDSCEDDQPMLARLESLRRAALAYLMEHREDR